MSQENTAFEEMLVQAAAQADAPIAEGAEGYVFENETVAKEEKDDSEVKEQTPEAKAKAHSRMMKKVVRKSTEHISAHTRGYRSRKGNLSEMEVLEQDALVLELLAQPDEPQYSAMAVQSRGGMARLSDEG